VSSNIYTELVDLYFKLGWQILPTYPDKKHPQYEWGEYQKRRILKDEFDLKVGEITGGTGSGYNIVVITGEISHNLLVLDLDLYKYPNILHKFKELLSQFNLDINKIPCSKTARGGRHFFFKTQEPIKSTPIKINGEQIDVKGEGGIIVLPPSTFEGGIYEWIIVPNEYNIPYLSLQQCINIGLVSTKLTAIQTQKNRITTIQSNSMDKFLQELFNTPLNFIPEGIRNETLAKLSGYLYSLGLPIDLVKICIKYINETKCSPPLAEKEIEIIVSSINKTIQKKIQQGYILSPKDKETINKILDKLKAQYGIDIKGITRKIVGKSIKYVIYFITQANTHTIELTDKQVLKWSEVKREIFNKTNIIAEMKTEQWQKVLYGLSQNIQEEVITAIGTDTETYITMLYKMLESAISKRYIRDIKEEEKKIIEERWYYFTTDTKLYFTSESFKNFIISNNVQFKRDFFVEWKKTLGAIPYRMRKQDIDITFWSIDKNTIIRAFNDLNK
jgi:hypothetical protein